jgi:hypothetical protein
VKKFLLALLLCMSVVAPASAAISTNTTDIVVDGLRVKREVFDAIMRASKDTGVDSAYMMALAERESGFNPASKAKTSSAKGLYQFIDGTWLLAIHEFGRDYGLEDMARSITIVNGNAIVSDRQTREAILKLRNNPYLSAAMAAEMLKRDRFSLASRLGRELAPSEFYLPHFFGKDGAGKFLETLFQSPSTSAPSIFPAAASANRPLFFGKSETKRVVKTVQIQKRVQRKIVRYTSTRIVKIKVQRQLTVKEVYANLGSMMSRRIVRYASLNEQIAVP